MVFYDLHSHILPGLDDGAFSADESMEMASLAAADGIAGLVCTPHYFPLFQYEQRQLIERYRMFYRAVHAADLPLRLALGQEIFLGRTFPDTLRKLEDGSLLTLNRSVYPLVELDPEEPEESAVHMLGMLCAHGFKPILAHPERYRFVCEYTDSLLRLRKIGVLFQITAGSLFGAFGFAAGQTADFMLEHRLCDFIASDAHNPRHRPPLLRDAFLYVQEQISPEYAEVLLCRNPLRVLQNQEILLF